MGFTTLGVKIYGIIGPIIEELEFNTLSLKCKNVLLSEY